jgi:hypothetical protein
MALGWGGCDELGETFDHFSGSNSAQLQLFDTRRVDDKSAPLQWMKLHHRCRMSATIVLSHQFLRCQF